jgi:hypothetical protein
MHHDKAPECSAKPKSSFQRQQGVAAMYFTRRQISKITLWENN